MGGWNQAAKSSLPWGQVWLVRHVERSETVDERRVKIHRLYGGQTVRDGALFHSLLNDLADGAKQLLSVRHALH
jgi:hypothetical protein